jgi:ATP-dependent DNA ligase
MWTVPEPMLAAPVPDPVLPAGWAAEMKWDGWRTLLSWDAGRLMPRSRKAADLAPSFPEIRFGAAQLQDATALDGELVVWEGERLAFERRQERLQRPGWLSSGPPTSWPLTCCYWGGADTSRWPYWRRRVVLEALFAERLNAPWALCPSTTDPATVREWLTSWTGVGLEGVVYKRLV